MKLTDRRKKAFLVEFSRHGVLVRAARAVGPRASARYGAVQTFEDGTRPCLRCRKPFESGGKHNRLCGPCGNRASDASPHAF